MAAHYAGGAAGPVRYPKPEKHKRWKLTGEDWRNRKDWFEYEQAAHDMVQHTSTHRAPWVLVPANNKHHARITVLEEICRRIEAKLNP